MTEKELVAALVTMERDPNLITKPSFTTNKTDWPNNQMPFVAYHVQYVRTHKLVTPEGYLSNLRLMLKVRR